MSSVAIYNSATRIIEVVSAGPQGPPGEAGTDGAAASGAMERENIIYLAKSGSDSSAGTTPDAAVLTLGQALTLANTLTESDGSVPVWIVILDAGTYVKSGSTTLDNNLNIWGPMATLTTRLVLRDTCTVHLNTLLCDDHPFPGIKKNTGAFKVIIDIDDIDGRGPSGTNTGEDLIINDGSGVLFVYTKRLFVPPGGRGVGDDTSGFGHIHLHAADVYLSGDDAIGIDANNSDAKIVGYIDHILETGGPHTGTIGVRANTAGSEINMTINEIVCDTGVAVGNATAEVNLIVGKVTGTSAAYNVSAGTLRLMTLQLSGTQTVTGGSVQLGPVTS